MITRRDFIALLALATAAAGCHGIPLPKGSITPKLVSMDIGDPEEIVTGYKWIGFQRKVEVVLREPVSGLALGEVIAIDRLDGSTVRFELENFWDTESGLTVLCGRLV